MRVGFIGTGTMGNPMARCLLEGGHELTVHDIRREATANLCEMGAHWADDPRSVGKASEVVFTSLPGLTEVEEVVLHPTHGILTGLTSGCGYIDVTTNSPKVFRKIAEGCRQRGIEVLDAPVSQRPPNMTMMVGGDPGAFAKYKPLLDCMGRHVFYVGGSGKGCIAKLVTQHMGYTNFIAAAEGLLIAARAGLDLNVLAEIVPVSAGASRAFDHFPRAVFDGQFASAGTLDIVAKDLHLACELAREVGAPSPVGNIADDVFKRAQAQGLGQRGFPTAVRVLEQVAGAEIRSRSNSKGG